VGGGRHCAGEAGLGVFGVHRVADVPILATVVMPVVCMGVVARMPREMDMRPAGMPRHFGLRRVHMRHRGSAEERLHDHEDGKQESHRDLVG
jgi:hypothetical protein